MTDKALRAIIWVAVSKSEQATADKISLPEQDRLIREHCTQHGYRIVDKLSVPGYSRSESDIITMLEDYAQQGIFAYHKLREHWQKRDFDVLIAFDSSRLARSMTLYAWVIENTIRAGAKIFLIQGGELNESNVDFQIALGGIAATAGLRRLVKMTEAGMRGRMDRGLSMNSVPNTHRLVYDEFTGNALRLEVKEELRRLFDDAAQLVLAGIGWGQFPLKLKALGHLNPNTNRPYAFSFFHKLFHNPYTWGASARKFLNKYGIWAFDESVPLPEGVEVNRHPNPPIPPVYVGKIAEDLKAELQRRADIIRGRASPERTYKFTGLLICQECGRRITVSLSKARKDRKVLWVYWACPNYLTRTKTTTPCSQAFSLHEDQLQAQIDAFFERMRALKKFDVAEMIRLPENSVDGQIAAIDKDIQKTRKQLDTLIIRQSKASEAAQERYQVQIDALAEHLQLLEDQRLELQAKTESPESAQIRQQGFAEITDLGDNFWSQDARVINQSLHRALGKHRFVVLNGQIIDVK